MSSLKLVKKTVTEKAWNFDQKMRAKQQRDREEQVGECQDETAVIDKLEELFASDEFKTVRKTYQFGQDTCCSNEQALTRFMASWFQDPLELLELPTDEAKEDAAAASDEYIVEDGQVYMLHSPPQSPRSRYLSIFDLNLLSGYL
jgi:hypothetical protein